MAVSPTHRWGQILGQEFLEVAIEPLVRTTAAKHGLFLDCKGDRPARAGKKISWVDSFGNTHDLDFVLERGGTPYKIGTPVAFIETAWRRYTKHSRNKAQEIQGAILPLVATHQRYAPFIGVVLAGVFTQGALTQLDSLGFKVLYFPYDSLVSVFAKAGIDASFHENTPDSACVKKIADWTALPLQRREQLAIDLLQLHTPEVKAFVEGLEKAITRQLSQIRILPLHGTAVELDTVEKAIALVENYDDKGAPSLPLAKYEIQIRYNNNDAINGIFEKKDDALAFLRSFQVPLHPAN